MATSLRKASQRAIQDANLNSLDSFGTDRGEVMFEDELDAVEQAVGQFIQRVKENQIQEDMIVSGGIADIKMERDGNVILVTAPAYLEYQDKGVNGSEVKLYDTPFSYSDKRPPIGPIKDWVEAKGIGGDNPDSAAYAIREKIFKEGIAPTNVYSKEIPQLVEDIKQHIVDFTINNIMTNI